MGKGGGGGGGGGKIDIPQALGSNQGSLYYNAFNPLGTFGSSGLGSLQSLYNWAADIATGGNVGGNIYGQPGTGTITGIQGQTYAPFTGAGGGSGINPFNGGSAGGGGGNSLLGPILGGEFSALGGMGQTAADLAQSGASANLLNQGKSILNTGDQLVRMATHGTGLFPSQQAMINQSVASQQAATQQQLGNMGLGSSTVAQNLAGQIKLSGAAAAGQLVQGNLQLGEEEQQLGVQTTQAGAQINEALFSEYQSIANQSQSLQSQMYQEALAGEGALGNMMNTTLQAFGYSARTQEDVLNANIAEAGIQARLNEAGAQASANGFSSLMGGLGSLLGQGGSGGGLLGGLGGLLGGGGAGGLGASGFLGSSASAAGLGTGAWEGAVGSALGSTAGAAGGAAGGIGGALSGIGSFIGALFSVFCMVAQTAYGLDDPRWILFRQFLLFRSPKWFRKAYIDNAPWVSHLIRKHETLRRVVKWLMDVAIWYDEATREIRER